MTDAAGPYEALPTTQQIRRAITLYLEHAYGQTIPERAAELAASAGLPTPDEWLASDAVERDPAHAPLPLVRSFAVRLGNAQYPHMKLRISRPPRDEVFLFSVDSHDGFLQAKVGSADYEALEALKAHNGRVASAVTVAWEAEDLPTERNYLRRKILQARQKGSACPPRPGDDRPARP